MKKLFITLIGILVGLLSVQNMMAQVVEVRPTVTKVVVHKPVARTGYVWKAGHWKWNSRARTYVWVGGSYVKARKGKVWVNGHWARVRGGWVWRSGHWKRI